MYMSCICVWDTISIAFCKGLLPFESIYSNVAHTIIWFVLCEMLRIAHVPTASFTHTALSFRRHFTFIIDRNPIYSHTCARTGTYGLIATSFKITEQTNTLIGSLYDYCVNRTVRTTNETNEIYINYLTY